MQRRIPLFIALALLVITVAAAPHSAAQRRDAVHLASACVATALRAQAGWQGATGALMGTVTLVNRSAAACSLLSGPGIQPRVQVLDAAGKRLAVQMAPQGVHSMLLRLVVLRPGQRVRATMRWSNWCRAYRGSIHLRVTVPGTRGAVTVAVLNRDGKPVLASPRCDSPTDPSTIQLSPFA